jgi:hypothetical protein
LASEVRADAVEAAPNPPQPATGGVLTNESADARHPSEQCWVEAVPTRHPHVATAEELAQQFRQIFKDQDSDALKSWMVQSLASEIPELERFVGGLQRDFKAVTAAVEQCWSNGQVEGQCIALSSSSGGCTAAVDSCFYVDERCPSDALLRTLPDLHQKRKTLSGEPHRPVLA